MEQTDQLLHDISNAESHTNQIEIDVKALDNELNDIHRDLQTSKTVNDSLHSLDDSLTTASQLLSVVAICAEGALTLKAKIDKFHTPIQQAVKDSDAVEKIVGPIRTKIEDVEPKVAATDTVLLATVNAENQFINVLGSAEKCINFLPDSDIKTSLENKMEDASGRFDPVVLKFDAVQVDLLTSIEKAKNLADQIESWAKDLIDLNVQIGKVLEILSPLIKALQDVADAFKQTIRVPYGGYPKICYKKVLGRKIPYPCGWVDVYYTFTIQQILNGLNGVIQPVVDLLNKAMDVVLDPLLEILKKKMNIDLPDLPGLDVLTVLINQLDATFNSLSGILDSLLGDQTLFTDFEEELNKIFEEISEINNQCVLNTAPERT